MCMVCDSQSHLKSNFITFISIFGVSNSIARFLWQNSYFCRTSLLFVCKEMEHAFKNCFKTLLNIVSSLAFIIQSKFWEYLVKEHWHKRELCSHCISVSSRHSNPDGINTNEILDRTKWAEHKINGVGRKGRGMGESMVSGHSIEYGTNRIQKSLQRMTNLWWWGIKAACDYLKQLYAAMFFFAEHW